MQLNAVSLASFCQFLDDISLKWSAINRVIATCCCFKERETIVMTCGNGDILSPSSFNCAYPSIGIKLQRVESFGQLRIFLIVNVSVGHNPFGYTHHRVEPPMQKNSKLLVLKLFTCFKIFCRWLIRCLCHADIIHQQGCND